MDFPETPGALTRFLTLLGDKFNISLFHYRYTGQNVGDVFLGILPMEESEVGDFQAIISELVGTRPRKALEFARLVSGYPQVGFYVIFALFLAWTEA